VVHGETGLVVDQPDEVGSVADAIGVLLDDPGLRLRLGAAGRARAVAEFGYDVLAERLAKGLAAWPAGPGAG
jgi:glycosyltransferase involved in cell wall biosynthesis